MGAHHRWLDWYFFSRAPSLFQFLLFRRTGKRAYEQYLTSGAGYAFGYWFNGWIERSRRINWRPEYRLHGVWIAIGTMGGGLLTYGFTLNYGKHWIGLAFGWGMVVAGMIASTVLVLPCLLVLDSILTYIAFFRSITAYNLEKYPDHSTVVSAIINAWRTASGFSVGYFQPAWITRNGISAVFGTQVAVVVAVLILTITPVIIIEGREAKAQVARA